MEDMSLLLELQERRGSDDAIVDTLIADGRLVQPEAEWIATAS